MANQPSIRASSPGIPPSWGPRHKQGWDAFGRQVDAVEAAGWEFRRAELPWSDDLNHWATVVRDLLHGEMARAHADWFAAFGDLYRPRTRQAVERGQSVTERRLAECRYERARLIDLLEHATAEAGVDCWVCPATGTVAPLGYENTGDSWMTSFWSLAGWPAITLPVFDGPEGLPYGLQCVAPAGNDEVLLAVAADLQQTLAVISHR